MTSNEHQLLLNSEAAGPAKSTQSDKRRQYCLAALVFLIILIVVIVVAQVTRECDGGFEWWGDWYCPGDCVFQDGAEYCPLEDERPMLMYEVDVNENAICMDGT